MPNLKNLNNIFLKIQTEPVFINIWSEIQWFKIVLNSFTLKNKV